VADYRAAKVLTFEPSLPSYHQSYTVFDMDTEDCEGSDTDCSYGATASVSAGGDTGLGLSLTSGSEPGRRRTFMQSVGNFQEATLRVCVHVVRACYVRPERVWR
jgi:hypothetical protein